MVDVIDSFRGPYSFLSNFYYSEIEYGGIRYPTVEHAFQAAKSLDLNERKWISAARTPTDAKRLGRQVELRPNWEDQRKYHACPLTGEVL